MTDKIRSSGTSDAESEGGTSSYQKTFEGGGCPDGPRWTSKTRLEIFGFRELFRDLNFVKATNQNPDDAHTLKGNITLVLTP